MAEFLDMVWFAFSLVGAALVLFLVWVTWMAYSGRAEFFIGMSKHDDNNDHLGV